MDKRSTVVSLALFLFMPFLALLRVFFYYKLPETKNVIWLFTIFYGLTFVIIGGGKDAARYKNDFVKLAEDPHITFEEFTGYLYNEDTRYVDIAQPLISFIVSRFTNSPKYLFATFGLVFGFFYSRNINYLLLRVRQRMKPEAIPFIVLFALLVAIWQINGFRFWTAAHVFIYGIFNLNDGKKVKGILFSTLSLLVHFSFVLPLIVLLFKLLLGNRIMLFFIIYFASFFIDQVSPDSFTSYTSQLPSVFEERTQSYLSEEYLETRMQDTHANWYVEGRYTVFKYALTALLVVVFFKYRKDIREDTTLAGLLSFGLLLSSVTTILNGIPSMDRFYTVANMAILAALFILVQMRRRTTFKWWVRIPFIASFVLYTIVEIRVGFDSMGLMTIIGNPLTTLFVEEDTPLINYIK